MGIVRTSLGSCRAELESGRLVRIFQDWDLGFIEFHAVSTGGATAKPSVRAFTGFLVSEFRGIY
jgi:DNA-binding transcriptional LysR family regulator